MMARTRQPWSTARIGSAILASGLAVIVFGHVHHRGWHWTGLIDDLYANVGSELAGMAVVILLVDRLAARRENDNLRRQLVRELGSTDRGLTARAVLELEVKGWLYDGTLAGAQLSGAQLGGARLERAAMPAAVFAGADLTHANLSNASVAGANFAEAVLERANLEMADLTRASLIHARLPQADAALAILTDANLYGADLTDADLTSADLSGADLRAADLTRARLTSSHLTAIRWNPATQWPAGFTPPTPPDTGDTDLPHHPP
jgi:hypothetical protein